MTEAQMRRALTELAEETIPEVPDFWPGIRQRMSASLDGDSANWRVPGRASSWPRPSPWARIPARTAVLVVALIGVLLVGTGFAALPLLQQRLSESPEGEQMLAYGKTMDMMRTVNGFTISLDFAYADSAGGLLGYTITGPEHRTFNNLIGHVRLSTADGTNIPITGGSGIGMESGADGNFASFGSIPEVRGRTEIPLRLTVDAIEAINPDASTDMVSGPWVFDFTAPVAPTRMLSPRQTVVSNGWPVTLESITMTPPGTWITLRGAGPDADVELIAGGKSYHLYQDGFTGTEAIKGCFAGHRRCPDLWKDRDVTYQAVAMEPTPSSPLDWLRGNKPGLQEDKAKTAEWMRELQQAHGEWTIVVKPDHSFANPIFELEGGPWVFHVSMP